MKASDFKNQSVRRVTKGEFTIELYRWKTTVGCGWYVRLYNARTDVYALNQYYSHFRSAKKHFESLCLNCTGPGTRYILKDMKGNFAEFRTDNLRTWLVDHTDQTEQYEVFRLVRI